MASVPFETSREINRIKQKGSQERLEIDSIISLILAVGFLKPYLSWKASTYQILCHLIVFMCISFFRELES